MPAASPGLVPIMQCIQTCLIAELNALLHDLLGDLGIGQDEHRLRLLGNGLQVRIAGRAFKGVMRGLTA